MANTTTDLLGQEASARVGEHLQATLFDLLAICYQSKQAHWNITGCNFRELHQQFDDIFSAAVEASDETAERLAALGISPDGRGVSVVNESNLLAMPGGFLGDRQAVEFMVHNIEKACRATRARLEPVGELDLVSQDVLIGVIRSMEKQLWMLQSRLCEPR